MAKPLDQHKDQKVKVLMVILGQCSQAVKSKLASEESHQALEEKDGMVGLLAKLKEMAFSTGGVRHPHMALQEVM